MKSAFKFVAVGTAGFILGSAATYFWIKNRTAVADPFGQLSLPQAPEKREEQEETPMQRHEEIQRLFQEFFDEQFSVPPINGTGIEGIERRDTEDAVLYEIPLEGELRNAAKDQFKIAVDEGQITISTTVKRQTQGHESFSRFQRSFPVPAGVDESRVQVRQEGRKIIIQFPRIK